MADDRRVYSDEEFALILRTAAEMASRADQPGFSSNGLTLAEIKSAAAQAGLDPALVEQAARMLVPGAKGSPFERLIGGPLRHEHEAQFRVPLTEDRAARLLSAVRISAAHFHSANEGHSSALGMTWSASGEGDVVSVVARPDGSGTSVSVVVDRRGTLVLTGVVSGLVMLMSLLAGVGMYSEIPQFAPWIPVVVGVGMLTVVRSFWSSSTRKVRERIRNFMEAMGQTLVQPEKPRVLADGSAGSMRDATVGSAADQNE